MTTREGNDASADHGGGYHNDTKMYSGTQGNGDPEDGQKSVDRRLKSQDSGHYQDPNNTRLRTQTRQGKVS